MPEHTFLLALAAFVVGMSKGGLGSAAALAVPMLAIWMDPLAAAALLLPVYIISDVVGVWLYRREYSSRNLKILIPAGCGGVVIATLLEPFLSENVFTFATGVIGLAYCLQVWHRRGRMLPPTEADVKRGTVWGALTGMTSFISHSGAPPFQAYVLPQRLPKLEFAGTMTICFAAINLAKLPAYGALGLMSGFDLPVTSALCLAAIIGTFAGRWISKALPDRIYMRVIHVLLFLLSLQLLWQSGVAFAGR